MGNYRRLMGFLRPYRRELWGSLVFAWFAIGMTVLIPLAGRRGRSTRSKRLNKSELLPLALVIIGASVLRLGLTMVRRLVAGKVSLAVEFDLRQLFYAHLQRLELGFFDSQQTGQLMSRATVDLQSIRFFLGYGLDLHHPEPADDRPGERGDDRDQAAAGADRAGSGAASSSSPPPAITGSRVRLCRRSSSGSPS